jgi:multiple sugar transport system substrate-binding protein
MEEKMKRFTMSVSKLLILLVTIALLITACQPQIQEVPVEVIITQIVEGEVVERIVTQIVEVVAPPTDYGDLVWLSTQLRPVQEAERVRGVILTNFPGTVEFIPDDEGPFHDRITAEVQTGSGTIDVLGALHGNFSVMAPLDQLQDLTALRARLADRGIPDAYWDVTHFNTDATYYIPWMQATYIIAINKQALDYLPAGVDVEALTYDDLLNWAQAIYDATGDAKLGFPAGESGLLHRWFQGFLIPAFSGGVVTTFASPEAAVGWQWMKDIWPYVHPQSTTFNFMQEQLLSEEVWIAWDHTARLLGAFEAAPDDFIAVPVPAGPMGRAYMPVLAGLAIPVTTTNQAGAEALIEYLTQTDTQVTTLREVGFFPVVGVDFPAFVSPGVKLEGEAVSKQSASADALPSLLPQGLGGRGGDFNKVFRDAFTRIVFNGEDINSVLADEKVVLQEIMTDTGAPCWAPDPDSAGQACQVE